MQHRGAGPQGGVHRFGVGLFAVPEFEGDGGLFDQHAEPVEGVRGAEAARPGQERDCGFTVVEVVAQAARAEQGMAREATKRAAVSADKPRAAEGKPVAGKMSFNDKRELEALPDRIAALEGEQAALHERMADPVLYQEAPQEVAQIKFRLEALEAEIEAAMLRWEALESRAASS